MRRFPVLLDLLVASSLCCFFLNCTDTPTNFGTPPPGSTQNNFFGITSPTAGAFVRLDSPLLITWISANATIDPIVKISLYRNDTLVQLITSYSSNNGRYTWSMSSYTTIPSGDRYRIKIASATDSTRHDFGGYFTIRSRWWGTIVVTEPNDSTSVRIDSTLTIRWTTTDSIGPYVRIQLYSDSRFVSMLSSMTGPSTTEFPWYPSAAIVPGNRYRIKISAYYDTTISAWSSYFTLKSQYYGAFAFTNPTPSSVFEAGIAYTVRWLFSGSPGSYINLLLYKDSIYVSTIAMRVSQTSPEGTCPWTVSTGLVSSKEYQVKVVSYYDSTLYAYSSRFSINGIVTDTFENDDSVRLAKPIPTDSTFQWHNLTVNDADWMTFNATAPRLYVINAACSTNVTVHLYANGNPTVSIGNAAGTIASNARIVWFCSAAGKYNLLVRPQIASYTGSYRISVKEYDSTAFRFRVTRPVADTAFVRGSICPVAWNSAVDAGGNVAIFLFDAASAVPVRTIAPDVPNLGSYSGVIDGDVPAGTAYYIKVVSLVNAAINGSSGTFKITQ